MEWSSCFPRRDGRIWREWIYDCCPWMPRGNRTWPFGLGKVSFSWSWIGFVDEYELEIGTKESVYVRCVSSFWFLSTHVVILLVKVAEMSYVFTSLYLELPFSRLFILVFLQLCKETPKIQLDLREVSSCRWSSLSELTRQSSSHRNKHLDYPLSFYIPFWNWLFPRMIRKALGVGYRLSVVFFFLLFGHVFRILSDPGE